MKKKLLIAAVAAFAMCLSAGLAACSDDEINLVKVEAVAATCATDGNIAYWYREDDGSCYSDEKGEHKIDIADTVVHMTGEHAYGDDGKCTNCGVQLVNDGLVYTLSSDGSYYTLTSARSCVQSTIFVPQLYDGVPVEKIASSAFYNSNAEKIIIGGNVGEIDVRAFENCTNLKEVVLPNSLLTICDYAFSGCTMLKSVEIPVGVRYMGACVFEDCVSLANVTLHDRLTSLGAGTFRGCASLEYISLPDQLAALGAAAFSGCSSLVSIAIPAGVTQIEDNTFYDCKSLVGVSLQSGLTRIGSQAFSGCESLVSIGIPESVTRIDAGAFEGCSSLLRVTLPQNITDIADDLFNGCTTLKTVEIAGEVTAVGARAFKDCASLFDITLPDSLTAIGDYAFAASALSDAIIPDGVTTIGEGAFKQCKKLKYLTLGEGLKSIGCGAFYGCPILLKINYNAISVDDFTSYSAVFTNSGLTSSGITLNVGAKVESIPAYAFTRDISSNESSSPAITGIVFESGSVCSNIGDYAFYYCGKLAAVVLPESCASVGEYAFANCSSLAAVTLSDNLTYIGSCAFMSADIAEIYVPDSVTAIGGGAFRFCGKLADITLGGGLTSVGKDAFYYTAHYNDESNWIDGTYYAGTVAADTTKGQTQYESLTIRNGTTIIADSAFEFKYITEVYIPAGVKYIGDYAFRMCVNLKKVTYESGSEIIEIGEKAFSGCVSLTDN